MANGICQFSLRYLSLPPIARLTQGFADQGSDSCLMQGNSSQTKNGAVFVRP